MNQSDYHRERYQRIKADPVLYAEYLERKRRERRGKVAYETGRKRKWRLANPEAATRIRAANHAVEHAIDRGELIRPDVCSKCGKIGPVDGHHPSYEKSQWLVVMWLCKFCHAKEHAS